MKNFILNILPFNNREEMSKPVYVTKKLLAFLLCMFGGGVAAEICITPIVFLLGGHDISDTALELLMYYGYVIIIGLIMLYWRFIEKKSLTELGFTKKFSSYFLGWAAAAVLLGASIAVIAMTGAIKFNGVSSDADIPVIALYFGAFVFQGIYEEILTRGLLLQTLRRKLPLHWSVVISSAPFVLLHLSSMNGSAIDTLLSVANLIAVSVLFSLLTIRTKGIWASCGLHSLWNFMLYCVVGLNLSGMEGNSSALLSFTASESNILNGGSYGIEASAVTLSVLTAGCIIMAISSKKHK